MRPLARWTFGMSLAPGAETIRQSVRRFRLLYPEFDLTICHNHATDAQKATLKALGVSLHAQSLGDSAAPLEDATGPVTHSDGMPGWGWKLAPPRLRPDAHELWIDNDIVFRHRLPSIDAWLTSSRSIISTGLRRAYGTFDARIPHDHVYCAGLFGLPPFYDFKSRIRHLWGDRTLGHYDEQGLTTVCVLEREPVVVPQSELAVVKKLVRPFPAALHFIGANRTDPHAAWEEYKCYDLM